MNRLFLVTVTCITIFASGCATYPETFAAPERIQATAEAPPKLIRIARQYHFDASEAKLSPSIQADLTPYAAYLKEHPDTVVKIEGHADPSEPSLKGGSLSERRAQVVAAFLASQGLSSAQMEVRGYGTQQPVLLAETERARALNRRVVMSFEMGKTLT